jgi:hypothetical protein
MFSTPTVPRNCRYKKPLKSRLKRLLKYHLPEPAGGRGTRVAYKLRKMSGILKVGTLLSFCLSLKK